MKCCDQPGLIPVEQAIDYLLSAVKPVAEVETVPVIEALGRVLAEDQIAGVNVPPADNSGMDGYAVNTADLSMEAERVLTISQRIPAGTAPEPLVPGTAARIFTGAEVPPGANAVVMQEQCQESGATVVLPAGVEAGQHIRPRGMDIEEGTNILQTGHRLQAQDLGLLASVGFAEVPVFRRLKIAVLSSGDEVREPGQQIESGQIYNANRFTLAGQIASLGMELLDLGCIPDNAEATERALREAAEQADCIITSGGVSVGEEDHIKDCVEKLGSLDLWRMAIKPGKPLAFGSVAGVPFFGLPGNPVSVFVTFALVARPYLLKYQGASKLHPLTLQVPANFARPMAAMRQEYLRARLVHDSRGRGMLELFPNQNSGVLSSTSWANGFAVHSLGQAIELGQSVTFIPFSELF